MPPAPESTAWGKPPFNRLNVLAELSGKVMNVLQRASSVRGVRELTSDEVRRMEVDWNTVFTKLGVVQGQRPRAEGDGVPHTRTARLTCATRKPTVFICQSMRQW